MPIRERVEVPRERKPRRSPQTFAPAPSSVKAIFVFRPHPYVVRDGNLVADDHALDSFWALLCRRFEFPIPAYRVCEVLDIHRCVLEEWLRALDRREPILRSSKEGIDLKRTDRKLGLANLKPATLYDPWRDREHDRFMGSYFAAFPWHVIDKYYLISVDEVLYYTGERRIRPDGRPFTPPHRNGDDPFAAFRSPQGWKRGQWPEDAYHDLCEKVTGQTNQNPKTGRRVKPVISRAAEDAARVAAQTEARIDRLGIRGHIWLEDFLRRSPWTRDEWFTKALEDERHRHEGEKRWQELCRKNPTYNRGKLTAFKPKPKPA